MTEKQVLYGDAFIAHPGAHKGFWAPVDQIQRVVEHYKALKAADPNFDPDEAEATFIVPALHERDSSRLTLNAVVASCYTATWVGIIKESELFDKMPFLKDYDIYKIFTDINDYGIVSEVETSKGKKKTKTEYPWRTDDRWPIFVIMGEEPLQFALAEMYRHQLLINKFAEFKVAPAKATESRAKNGKSPVKEQPTTVSRRGARKQEESSDDEEAKTTHNPTIDG